MQRQDQLWYHVVWGTKHRQPVLQAAHLKTLLAVCAERGEEWQFQVAIAGGIADHIHILIQIHPDRPVSKVIGWIKGSTSHHFGEGFEWQSGYLIQTVSLTDLTELKAYIEQQESLHLKGDILPERELPVKR